jgi:hypothetical protein
MFHRKREHDVDLYVAADRTVFVALQINEDGTVEAEEGSMGPETVVICYSSPALAKPEADAEVRSVRMAELAVIAPAGYGIVLDPDAEHPLHVHPEERPALASAGEPFPQGASVRLGVPAEPENDFTKAVSDTAEDVAALASSRWCFYSLSGTPLKQLVVYETSDGSDAAVEQYLHGCLDEHPADRFVFVLNLEDIPDEPRQWILESVKPFYIRGTT